ncbi:MAG: hypothetical protein KGN34_17070 [Sphingomonadales bacterium]|nr:hypothetical protein [Sphingomonadales bacterium]
MAQLRSDLAEARAGQAQAVAVAQAANTAAEAAGTTALAASNAAAAANATAVKATTGLATLEKKPAPEGFRDGGSTVRLGGYLKLVASNSHFSNGSVATNTLGRDFYLPQTIPTTVGGKGFTSQDFTAKQARLWLNLDTTVAGHVVKGYLETDFQTTASAAQNVTGGGSQRTTNGYTLALRRAYVTLDRFTFGQDWTTFQYTAALPETTDYVGGAEGTVFVRQPQVRYSAPLGKGLTLHVAAENPESAIITAGSTATLESGTDHMPDFTARLAWTGKRGELSLAGLVRQVRGESTGAALVNNVTTAGATGTGVTATGVGASLGGKLFLADDKSSDLRFIATYGKNIGRYVGLNFAPDAVYNPATNQLTDVSVFAALVAARIALAPQLRVNVMGSYQHVGYDKALAAAQTSGLNKQAWSMAANLFYSPVKAVDLGIEYRHGERTVLNAATATGDAKGTLDRIELAAKYSF